MNQIEYLNPKGHTVHITGPDKQQISVAPHSRIVLSEWFKKYVPKYLHVVRESAGEAKPSTKSKPPRIIKQTSLFIAPKTRITKRPEQAPAAPSISKNAEVVRRPKGIISSKITKQSNSALRKQQNSKLVGRSSVHDANSLFKKAADAVQSVSISDNIGVGILSYNRPESLIRLLDSIIRTTDLSRTTVFVSDESDNQEAMQAALAPYANRIVIMYGPRLGVAGNSNRLMKCLSRFEHKFILNDDVEIMQQGWADFYIRAMKNTGMHHLCYREPGVYGATVGPSVSVNGYEVSTVNEKPHGAVMAFDSLAFNTVGYFDEQFGLYGMEHVDWSSRVSRSGIQKSGFHDIVGSSSYFKIHAEKSIVHDKAAHLARAREYLSSLPIDRCYVDATSKSDVPGISIVVPYRQSDRRDDLITVINCLRAMRFPCVDIVLSEQDATKHVDLSSELRPIEYVYTPNKFDGQHFNKSAAFNVGVAKAKYNLVVLHDADIIIENDYLNKVYETLKTFDSCHLGAKVFYLNEKSSAELNRTAHLSTAYTCERTVSYFEGGTLACTKSAYRAIGGFNEDYIGYGMEDCDFFERLSTLTKFNESRSLFLFHLHHGRVDGWDKCHQLNKQLSAQFKTKYPSISDYAAYLSKRLRPFS